MEVFLKQLETNRIFRIFTPLILILGVIVLYWNALHLDLWNDEIYSLIHFQQVPILQTVTDYHESNNHIFFNLLLNVYLKLIGNPDTLKLFHNPAWLRIIPLLFTLASYLIFFVWIKKMQGMFTAILACSLLAASIPYFNFALQYRAYSLLILLGTWFSYQCWLYFIDYKKIRLLWTGIITALMFYAHPAGLYLIIAIWIATCLFFPPIRSKNETQSIQSRMILLAMILGGIAAGLAYLPVIKQIMANPWVAGHKINNLQFLRDKFFSCTYQLLFSEGWVFVLAIIGFGLQAFAPGKIQTAPASNIRWMMWCLGIYFAFFLIPFIRHDDAPQRTFIMLIPFIITGLSLGVDALAQSILGGRYQRLLILIVSSALIFMIPRGIYERNIVARQFILNERENASLMNAYYLDNFHPMVWAAFAKKHSESSHLALYSGITYRQEMPQYLETLGIPYQEYRSLEQHMLAPDSFLVLTLFPNKFMNMHASWIDCVPLTKPNVLYTLLFVKKKSNPGVVTH